MVTALDLWFRGREFESHCGQEFFYLKFLVFAPSSSFVFYIPAWVSSCKWNELWHTPSQYPVLDEGLLEKILLPTPVVYNGSLKL